MPDYSQIKSTIPAPQAAAPRAQPQASVRYAIVRRPHAERRDVSQELRDLSKERQAAADRRRALLQLYTETARTQLKRCRMRPRDDAETAKPKPAAGAVRRQPRDGLLAPLPSTDAASSLHRQSHGDPPTGATDEESEGAGAGAAGVLQADTSHEATAESGLAANGVAAAEGSSPKVPGPDVGQEGQQAVADPARTSTAEDANATGSAAPSASDAADPVN